MRHRTTAAYPTEKDVACLKQFSSFASRTHSTAPQDEGISINCWQCALKGVVEHAIKMFPES